MTTSIGFALVPLLVVLFILVPIAELYVIIKVGQWIGLWPTLALLLADALLGALLLRQQGRAAWQRFSEAIAAGRFPGREAADGVMVAIGGTLLLTPGFITDVFGFLLLVPPTRSLLRSGMVRFLRGRFVLVGAATGAARRRRRPGESRDQPYDLEGEAREVPTEGDQEARRGTEPPRLPPS